MCFLICSWIYDWTDKKKFRDLEKIPEADIKWVVENNKLVYKTLGKVKIKGKLMVCYDDSRERIVRMNPVKVYSKESLEHFKKTMKKVKDVLEFEKEELREFKEKQELYSGYFE